MTFRPLPDSNIHLKGSNCTRITGGLCNLRAEHLRDVVTLSLADGHFHPKEYALCKQIALGLGFRPDVIDIIRQELNNQMGG